MTLYLWFVLAGAFAGLSAGLFGVGGGMIIVPALVWIFSVYGFQADIIPHLAVGTSLATIIVTSISSLTAHHKRGGVNWTIWKHMAIGLFLGSFFGAYVADQIDGQVLKTMIGVCALLVALKMLFLPNKEHLDKPLPPVGVQVISGGGIGLMSGIFGIGGGSLTVPFLSYSGLPMKKAVGTSSACGLPIALAGALGFAYFGQDVANLPTGTIGFVHIPAFVCIATASFIMAKFGARLAHYLPASRLKRAFGVLLLFVGSKMLWNGLIGLGIL